MQSGFFFVSSHVGGKDLATSTPRVPAVMKTLPTAARALRASTTGPQTHGNSPSELKTRHWTRRHPLPPFDSALTPVGRYWEETVAASEEVPMPALPDAITQAMNQARAAENGRHAELLVHDG